MNPVDGLRGPEPRLFTVKTYIGKSDKCHSTTSPLTSASFCDEKQRHLHAFLEAIQDLNSVQNAQLTAVLQGKNFYQYEDLIHAARERKDLAKYAFLVHVEEHHCYDGDSDDDSDPS